MSNLANNSEERNGIASVCDEFRDRHIVVTGGAGALGTAVVGLLLERGAWCHVPYLDEVGGLGELRHSRLNLVPNIDLRIETSVGFFYADLPQLWASIHLAGGYKSGSLLVTSLA